MVQTENEQLIQFYSWLLENEKEAKTALAKNVNFEQDVFEDAYIDTVISVARAIINNPNKHIKSFKDYFYLSSLYKYRDYQNKKRKRIKKQQMLIEAFEDFINNIDNITDDYE